MQPTLPDLAGALNPQLTTLQTSGGQGAQNGPSGPAAAHDQVAVDATDRLLLDEVAAFLAQHDSADNTAPQRLAVIDDAYGALTLGLAVAIATGQPGFDPAMRIRSFQDSHGDRDQLHRNAGLPGFSVAEGVWSASATPADALADADLVIVRLDKSLATLTELAQAIARQASSQVVVFAGGRIKHMNRSMNEVLAKSFREVHARLARQKSRVLIASRPEPAEAAPAFPEVTTLSDRELPAPMDVHAHGGVFAGTKLDIGTRTLLRHLSAMAPDAQQAMDLGCGTGILAVAVAQSRPGVAVLATDDSWHAVESARATARAAGVLAPTPTTPGVSVQWTDAASGMPDASIDLVLCNPPFHLGAAVSTAPAHQIFRAAGRVLRPGGELWTVFNRHLHYGAALREGVGPTVVVAADPKFVVTRSIKR